jgi:hypothetical protein
MCRTCWVKYGSHLLQTPEVVEAARLIDAVYDFSCVGGNAHIVVDDWNIEDNHIDWCLNTAIPENVHEAAPEQLAAEKAALEALRRLSIAERNSALALLAGYGEPE